jgi:hypothetical protein
MATADQCLPGLQGFPVQVTGWSGFTNRATLATPNDIQLQFSPSQSPMAYNKQNGSLQQLHNSTFIIGGSQYNVRVVRIAKPKHVGLSDSSVPPVAELSIWGTLTATSRGGPAAAVLVIPIFQRPVESIAGEAIYRAIKGEASKLQTFIPVGSDVNVVKYTTCLETQTRGPINISVAFWTMGAAMSQDMVRGLPSPLADHGIPDILGTRVLSSYTQYNDANQTKAERRFDVITNQDLLMPYGSAIALGVGTNEFQNGFRIIFGFQISTTKDMDTSRYKCIAIDRERDIRDGQLVVDPTTGRRLSEEVDAAKQAQEASLEINPQASSKPFWRTLAIIFGVLIGLSVLAGLYLLFAKFVLTRKGQGLPPVPPEVAAMAAGLPAPVVGNIVPT